jgi:hypothetical protein
MSLPALDAQVVTGHAIIALATVRTADPSVNLPAGDYVIAVVLRPEVTRWSVATIFEA